MTVDPRRVQGRRRLRFADWNEMLLDAERLVASPGARTLGNRPLDQLLTHLAFAVNGSIDGLAERGAWHLRLIGPLVKKRALRDGFPAGFRAPVKSELRAFPPGRSPLEALEALRAAVRRTETETMSAAHPYLGKLTHDEWLQFHLRHAELHLSFVVP